MKKICVITGTRAEYGIMKVLINKIILSKKLELMLYVTGAHLLHKYGHTIDLIKKDKLEITRKVPMYKEENTNAFDLGKSIGTAISNFSVCFSLDKPDLVLVLGDRFETFCAVIAATSLRIPIAHIHGGDHNFEGQVDEMIRHCISKFAHIHFPASEKSSKRLIYMGEDPKRIHVVGSPGIDMMLNYHFFSKEQTFEIIGLDQNKKTIVFIYHPYIPEHNKMGERIRVLFKTLLNFPNIQIVVIYPNNDLGSNDIIKEIETLEAERNPKFKIIKNLERILYLSLLKHSDAMVGNSSSGIIDSPTFYLPVVNIGKRNLGRESAENVLNASYKDLDGVLWRALSNDFKQKCLFVKSPYGDGKASERIVTILERLTFDEELLKKRFIL